MTSYLAVLVEKIETAQEHLFGRDAVGDRSAMAKLPSKAFSDFTPGGGLCTILEQVLHWRVSRGMTFEGLELAMSPPPGIDPASRHTMLSAFAGFFVQCHAVIRERSILPQPVVYIAPELKNAQRLAEVVKAKGGLLADREEQATIVVSVDLGDAEDDDELIGNFLVVRINGDLALLHWFRTPDSYNEWVQVSETEGCPVDVHTHR